VKELCKVGDRKGPSWQARAAVILTAMIGMLAWIGVASFLLACMLLEVFRAGQPLSIQGAGRSWLATCAFLTVIAGLDAVAICLLVWCGRLFCRALEQRGCAGPL